jgi:cell division septation protein DedD
MNDRLVPAGQQDEEDLLADFRDVPDENQGDKPQQAEDSSSDLDALDAFLTEFGQGDAVQTDEEDVVEAIADPLLEEVAELAAAVPASGADLHQDAVADDDDVPELSVTTDMASDDLNLDVVEDMAAPEPPPYSAERGGSGDLFTTAAAASAPTAAPVSIMAAEDESPADTRSLDVSTIGVALFSLVIAAVAGWFAVSLHGQMNDLRAELAQLRQQPAGIVSGPDLQTQETLTRLNQRVNEMAVLLDGPMSHLSDTGAQLNTMSVRVDELERRIASLSDELAATKRTVPPVAKAPDTTKAASPAPQRAAKVASLAPQLPTPASGGDWVVNVASLSEAKAAAAEQQRLQQAGFNVEVQTARMEGRVWYRVRATGFPSREQAQIYSDMIRHKMGLTPWVGLDK